MAARFGQLSERGKNPTVITTAFTREMVAFTKDIARRPCAPDSGRNECARGRRFGDLRADRIVSGFGIEVAFGVYLAIGLPLSASR